MRLLLEIYNDLLESSNEDSEYRVEKYNDDVFIGMDGSNLLHIFIKVDQKGKTYGLTTNHISIEFYREYDIAVNRSDSDDGLKRIVCHRISCNSEKFEDKHTFLSVMQSYVGVASKYDLSDAGLIDFFHSLVRLFKVQEDSDSKITRQGLWGELYFMKTHGGFENWCKYWHTDPLNIFDFSTVGKRIEIKTTTKSERIHNFSHNQVFSKEDVRIVSMQLRNDDAGLSLKTLIEDAREAFKGTSYYFKLEKAIRKAGMDGTNEEGPSFSESYVQENLAWFSAEQIPHFTDNEPEGVTGTHYNSNLTLTPKLIQEEIEDWIKLWSSIEE